MERQMEIGLCALLTGFTDTMIQFNATPKEINESLQTIQYETSDFLQHLRKFIMKLCHSSNPEEIRRRLELSPKLFNSWIQEDHSKSEPHPPAQYKEAAYVPNVTPTLNLPKKRGRKSKNGNNYESPVKKYLLCPDNSQEFINLKQRAVNLLNAGVRMEVVGRLIGVKNHHIISSWIDWQNCGTKKRTQMLELRTKLQNLRKTCKSDREVCRTAKISLKTLWAVLGEDSYMSKKLSAQDKAVIMDAFQKYGKNPMSFATEIGFGPPVMQRLLEEQANGLWKDDPGVQVLIDDDEATAETKYKVIEAYYMNRDKYKIAQMYDIEKVDSILKWVETLEGSTR